MEFLTISRSWGVATNATFAIVDPTNPSKTARLNAKANDENKNASNSFRYHIYKNYSLYNSKFSGYKSNSLVTDAGYPYRQCRGGWRTVQNQNGTDDEKAC